jgi:hypothetical protein
MYFEKIAFLDECTGFYDVRGRDFKADQRADSFASLGRIRI